MTDSNLLRSAQEEVRRSHAMFSTAFRASPAAMAISSLVDLRVIDVNDAAAALSGRSRDEMIGMAGEALGLWVDPVERERCGRAFAEHGVLRDFATQLRRCNGEVRDVVISIEPIEVQGERCALTVVTDVTAQRGTEARLAASEERYRRIVEHTAQGVLTIGSDDVLTFVNQRAAEMLGTTVEQMVGKRFRQFVAPEEQGAVAERRARRLGGASETYDSVLLTATGERLLVEVTASPLRGHDGEIQGALAMVSDVRLRRQAEDVRARLAAIVESSRDAIASWDADGTVQTWNAGAERMFGYSAAELIGRDIAVLVPDDRIPSHRESMAAILRGDVVAVETVRKRKDGSLVDVSLLRSPVMGPRGEVVAISSIARDITAQKNLETSLRETEQQLRHAQKMEAIGALAGGIAHDFNNLLSVVLSSVTLIEESLAPADPMAEDARAIREAAERAARLTRQLLAFSRRQVLEPRVVNLDRVIAGMETMMRRLLGERIELVIASGRSANVLIDPSQFEQVILNLVVNARDAMPQGGELTIETDHVTRPEGDFVKVRVSDTGCGMDDATRQRMFEPFFTTKDVGKGTGLGLSTVFGIVRQSGGFVQVESIPGSGTAIDLFVPRTDRAERSSGPTTIAPSMGGQGETILVVEDEEQVRKLVQKMLRRQGYQVLAAANAGEALLLAEQKPKIDLLLTDVVMPIINGRELAERLRALYPELPVVYMSGYHDDEALRGMIGSSDIAYLQKPVPREVLVRRIRDMLDRR